MTETGPDFACLMIDGPLTVRSIATVRARLLQALAGPEPVQVDCTAADSVDLSFIQLLFAARRSASAAGKRLTLAAPASGALRAALEQGGFAPDPFWSGDA